MILVGLLLPPRTVPCLRSDLETDLCSPPMSAWYTLGDCHIAAELNEVNKSRAYGRWLDVEGLLFIHGVSSSWPGVRGGWLEGCRGPFQEDCLLTPTLPLMPLDHGEARKKDYQKPRP